MSRSLSIPRPDDASAFSSIWDARGGSKYFEMISVEENNKFYLALLEIFMGLFFTGFLGAFEVYGGFLRDTISNRFRHYSGNQLKVRDMDVHVYLGPTFFPRGVSDRNEFVISRFSAHVNHYNKNNGGRYVVYIDPTRRNIYGCLRGQTTIRVLIVNDGKHAFMDITFIDPDRYEPSCDRLENAMTLPSDKIHKFLEFCREPTSTFESIRGMVQMLCGDHDFNKLFDCLGERRMTLIDPEKIHDPLVYLRIIWKFGSWTIGKMCVDSAKENVSCLASVVANRLALGNLQLFIQRMTRHMNPLGSGWLHPFIYSRARRYLCDQRVFAISPWSKDMMTSLGVIVLSGETVHASKTLLDLSEILRLKCMVTTLVCLVYCHYQVYQDFLDCRKKMMWKMFWKMFWNFNPHEQGCPSEKCTNHRCPRRMTASAWHVWNLNHLKGEMLHRYVGPFVFGPLGRVGDRYSQKLAGKSKDLLRKQKRAANANLGRNEIKRFGAKWARHD